MDFPANSYFDVFFDVDLNGTILHNEEPFRIECKIEDIPPYFCLYQPPIPDPIVLVDEELNKVATIEHAFHIPLPPKKSLLIFANERKVTPTPGPSATQTNTPAPNASPTATPQKALGDTNADGSVNSVDASLILQYVAGRIVLLPAIDHNGDVNLDGTIDAIDSLLILQLNAGLIEELPP
jgi:hypothetical protein